ncbi:MAG: M14 family metallopeptidase [Methylocystis sp.]
MSDDNCTVFDHIPRGFLDRPAARLAEVLPGPTLLDLPGRDPRPLFVSVLLHGNEDSGLVAAQEALRRWSSREAPRAMLLFIGNIHAAAQNLRTLPDQRDFNRVWPGTETPDTPEARMARWVYDYAARRRPFASIDIHNNTGFNPHYACVTRLEPQFVALARLFSRIVVHFQRPLGVHAGAFANLCPAVTVECGKAGGGSGSAHAAELIEAALSISQLPDHPPALHDIELLRTFAIVKMPLAASFSFDGSPADFQFRSDVDRLNFSDLPAGESFGALGASGARLELAPGDGGHAPEEYFDYAGGDIRLRRGAVPAMLTLDPNAIRLDCLCYLMHRIGMDGHRV